MRSVITLVLTVALGLSVVGVGTIMATSQSSGWGEFSQKEYESSRCDLIKARDGKSAAADEGCDVEVSDGSGIVGASADESPDYLTVEWESNPVDKFDTSESATLPQTREIGGKVSSADGKKNMELEILRQTNQGRDWASPEVIEAKDCGTTEKCNIKTDAKIKESRLYRFAIRADIEEESEDFKEISGRVKFGSTPSLTWVSTPDSEVQPGKAIQVGVEAGGEVDADGEVVTFFVNGDNHTIEKCQSDSCTFQTRLQGKESQYDIEARANLDGTEVTTGSSAIAVASGPDVSPLPSVGEALKDELVAGAFPDSPPNGFTDKYTLESAVVAAGRNAGSGGDFGIDKGEIERIDAEWYSSSSLDIGPEDSRARRVARDICDNNADYDKSRLFLPRFIMAMANYGGCSTDQINDVSSSW